MDNSLSELWFARAKDSPAKTWWNLPIWHPAIGRALQIDRSQPGGVYALAPFRLAQIEGRHLIVAAYPAPSIFAPADEDWLAIEAVIAWDPTTNKAEILNDPASQLVGAFHEPNLFGDARLFFQAWARARAQFAIQRQAQAGKDWSVAPKETDLAPGKLIIGDIMKINLPPSALPAHLACHGIDPQTVNRAIMKSARLPRLTSGMRAAA